MVSAETSGTPLQSAYTFLFMRRGKGAAKEKAAADAGAPPAPPDGKAKDAGGGEGAASSGVPYETSIKTLATVHTVEQFWDVYNHLIRPSDLPTTTDYHFFRDGIKPTWEDPSNAKRQGFKKMLSLALTVGMLNDALRPDQAQMDPTASKPART